MFEPKLTNVYIYLSNERQIPVYLHILPDIWKNYDKNNTINKIWTIANVHKGTGTLTLTKCLH